MHHTNFTKHFFILHALQFIVHYLNYLKIFSPHICPHITYKVLIITANIRTRPIKIYIVNITMISMNFNKTNTGIS